MAPATDDTLRATAADLGLDFDTGQRLAASAKPKPTAAEQFKAGLQDATRDPRYLKGDSADSPQLRRALRNGFEGLARMEGADEDVLDGLAPEQAVQVWRQRTGVEPSPQWLTPELQERWDAGLETEFQEMVDLGGVRTDIAQAVLDEYTELRGRLNASLDDTISAIKENSGRMLEPAVLRALEQWAREQSL